MKKLFSLIAVVMLTTLVLAGCGKDDKVQGVTEDSVTVGNCAATSGALASVGVPFNAGIEAYFDMVNADGGVDGREIEFVHQDDEFDQKKGIACTESMIHDEEVFALVGHFGTPTVQGTLDIVKEAGIPTVYLATGIKELYIEGATGEDRSVYPVQPIYKMEGRIITARAVGEFNADKIGVIYTNDDAGKDLLAGIKNQADKIGNIDVVDAQINPEQADVSSAVITLKDAGVDVVVVAAIQNTFPIVVKGLAAQGLHVPTLTTYSNADKTQVDAVATELTNTDGTLKFNVYSNAWVDLSDADALATYSTEIVKKDETYASNAYAMAGWIAGHFFVEGLKNVPEGEELTWNSYMDAIESEPIKNPFGGYIDFSDGKRFGVQEMSMSKMAPDTALGWEQFKPIANISEILEEE